MNEDQAEALVATFLHEHGFLAEQPSKAERRLGKTPDFRACKGDQICFFVEVKSVRGGDWLEKQIEMASPGTVVGGARPDPVFNRITHDIHEAVKQFDAVNVNRSRPNVLALVNYDGSCDSRDLVAVVTGNFHANDGSTHPIYKQYSEGRMSVDRTRVDLFLWFDPDGEQPIFFFNPVHQEHNSSLLNWFRRDPNTIRSV